MCDSVCITHKDKESSAKEHIQEAAPWFRRPQALHLTTQLPSLDQMSLDTKLGIKVFQDTKSFVFLQIQFGIFRHRS